MEFTQLLPGRGAPGLQAASLTPQHLGLGGPRPETRSQCGHRPKAAWEPQPPTKRGRQRWGRGVDRSLPAQTCPSGGGEKFR